MNTRDFPLLLSSKIELIQYFLAKNKLVTNTSVYVIGTMLQKALSFLLIPFYLNYLSPDDFGIVGLGTAVSGFLSLLLGLGIYAAIARFYHDFNTVPETLQGYITTNIFFVVTTTITFGILLGAAGDYFWGNFTSGNIPFHPYVILMIWGAASSVLVQIPLIIYQTSQRPFAFVVANISLFLVTMASIIYFVAYRGLGAYGQLLGSLLANIIAAGVLVLLALKENFSLKLQWDYVKISLIYSLPLVPHMLAGWAMNAIDRILLESNVSLTELGIYNLAYQLGMIMAVLVHSVHQAWLPYYYSLMKSLAQPVDKIRHIILIYISVLGGICITISMFSPEIINQFAPESYKGAALFIPLITFAYLLQGFYYLASSPLFYFKATRYLPIITLSAAAINLVINIILIPIWGAFASACATTISFAALLLGTIFLKQRYQNFDLPSIKLLAVVSIIFLGSIFSTFSAWLIEGISNTIIIIKILLLLIYLFSVVTWFILPVIRKNISYDV